MNISPINCQNSVANSTGFKANLWVDKSVQDVIKNNKKSFAEASKMFDGWLNNEKKHTPKTLTIRKNTSLTPNAVFKQEVSKMYHGYPHEDTGYQIRELVNVYEDLEFDLEGKKCGFWFNPAAGAEKLLSDFKNMFNHLQNS